MSFRSSTPSPRSRSPNSRDCGPEAVDEAVARAKSSFESGVWSGLPGRERAKILWRIADLIDEHAAEFAEIDSANTGMMKLQSEMVVPTCAEFFRYYAGWCSKINGTAYDIRTSGIASDSLRRPARLHAASEPYGVVGLIFPWNGPIFNACAKIAPALAAGCSSLVKPAEETPLSALLLDRLIHEAGVPEGVINLITGYGHTAGAAISAHPDVEKVAFTGSTEVGKVIVKASAGNLKKVMLELGGKSPVLIFDDADLDKAIFGAAMGIFVHSGQGCVCGSRIFVQRGVYERVVEGIAGVANFMKYGGPNEEGVMSGPLISEKQLNRVMGFIDEGRSEGVEVVTGGHRLDRKGYFVHPTVLTNVTSDMRLYQRGDLRPRRVHHPVRHRGRGRRDGQRHQLRAGGHRLDHQRQPRAPDRQATAGRQRSGQLPVGLRPRSALRRLQAVGLGPGVRPRRPRGLPEEQERSSPALIPC